MEFDPIAIITLIPALGTGLVAVFTWSHRFGHRARLFSLSMMAACLWSLSEAMFQASSTVAMGEIWMTIQFLAVPTVPVLWLLVIVRYTGMEKYITRGNTALLLAVPLVVFLLMATNHWHHLVYSGITMDVSGNLPQLVLERGPFFWLNIAYSYIIVVMAVGLLLQKMLHPQSVYRGQAATMLIALLVPIAINVIYLVGVFPVSNLDPLPFGFGLGGLIMLLSILRFRTLNLVPIARERILENMTEAVVVVDNSGRLIDYNRRAEVFFGWRGPKLGQSLQRAWQNSTDLQNLLSSEATDAEELMVRDDGVGKYYQVSVVPIQGKAGEVAGRIMIFHDVSRLKQVENELVTALEKEQVLRGTIEQEIKNREDFSRTLVHELKTPLTPILASSEILVSCLKEEPLVGMARNINRGAENLNRRIDELLDLAKGEVGMLQVWPQPVEVVALVTQIVSEMQPAAASHEQYLVLEPLDELPVVMADEARLRQIIQNLITNAFKFSQQGDTVTVRVLQNGDDVVVEVQDTGIGLTEEEQVKLFHPYERLDAEQRRLGGMGLGLALCKNLVELHGGRIWVESCKGEGSTFKFSLPVTSEASNRGTLAA